MSDVKSVAIAGASGAVGPHVIKALVAADFKVTVLTRTSKPGAYGAAVNVIEVDYASKESLTAALRGIDAIVSTVAATAIDTQITLIDAAVAAGVKRFIPSDYSSCSNSPKVTNLPLYAPMSKIKQYLQEKAKSSSLTWTVYATGAFLEFVLGHALVLDFPNRKAGLIDEGDNCFSSTTLPVVGSAIVEIFKNFEATKNRIVKTSQVILTQNQLIEISKQLKPDLKWETTKIQADVLLKEAVNDIHAGNFGIPVIMKLLQATVMGDESYGSAYDKTDNQLLGVKELPEEELKDLIAGKIA